MAQVSANPSRFSPLASGYLERARAMKSEGNFIGMVDQLRHLDTQNVLLSPAESEEFTYLLAEAYYQLGDPDCLRLLIEFRDDYPASPLAPKAALSVGDYYFFNHDWAEALSAYSLINEKRLNKDEYSQYVYRKALCLIKTGHFDEAGPLLSKLKNIPEYKNAYNFYTAYLDYIEGDFNKAYSGFAKVPDGEPGLDAGYYMAQIDYSKGKYEEVIKRGTALLRENEEPELSPEIERIVGLSYFKLGNLNNSRTYLTRYLSDTDAGPEADALYALGAIDYSEGRYNSAIERLSQVSDRQDAIGQGAWLYLGQCYMRQDNPSAAALAFEKASRMAYDSEVSETALYNYVTSVTRGGKVPFSSASKLLEQFVARYPDSRFADEVDTYLATAYYNDHEYDKALKYINSIRNPSIEIMEAKQKILYESGISAVSVGKNEMAIEYLLQCVALKRYNPNLSAQASLWLGDSYFSLGRYKEAAASYKDFLKDDSSNENKALGFYDLAYALYKLKDYKSAALNFQSALSAKPALEKRLADDARIRLGDCLYYTGRYKESHDAFSKAISDDASEADYALYRRSILYGLSGDTKSKIADLEMIENLYPQSRWLSKSLLEKAVTYEETGRNDLAAEAYKKRLNIVDEVDIDELLRMASAMNKSGHWNDLLEVVDRIMHAGGLEPDEMAEIDLYEADALHNLGRSEEAHPLYSRLARNPNSISGAKASVIVAEIDNSRGDYEDARLRMEEFTDAGSTQQYWLARGFIALADAYHGLGETNLAKEYLITLQENYPGSEADIQTMISQRLAKWK